MAAARCPKLGLSWSWWDPTAPAGAKECEVCDPKGGQQAGQNPWAKMAWAKMATDFFPLLLSSPWAPEIHASRRSVRLEPSTGGRQVWSPFGDLRCIKVTRRNGSKCAQGGKGCKGDPQREPKGAQIYMRIRMSYFLRITSPNFMQWLGWNQFFAITLLLCHRFGWKLFAPYSHSDAHTLVCLAALGVLLDAEISSRYWLFQMLTK